MSSTTRRQSSSRRVTTSTCSLIVACCVPIWKGSCPVSVSRGCRPVANPSVVSMFVYLIIRSSWSVGFCINISLIDEITSFSSRVFFPFFSLIYFISYKNMKNQCSRLRSPRHEFMDSQIQWLCTAIITGWIVHWRWSSRLEIRLKFVTIIAFVEAMHIEKIVR